MRAWTDNEALRLHLDLDREPNELDLSNGLGTRILDLAVNEMLGMVRQQRDPETGRVWLPDAPSTKKEKGHGIVGFRTGKMMNPSNWYSGRRQINRRSLNWTYAGPDYARYFHETRGIVGWTDSVLEDVERWIRDEVDRARAGE